jgi:hypothetical protein
MRLDLTSKKIPLSASQNLIAKLFGQQPVEVLGECSKLKAENKDVFRSLE